MIRFLVDADLPRSVVSALRQQGHHADDVREVGLSSASDDAILRFATAHGIIVARFPPHTPAPKKVRLLLRWIPTLQEADLPGNLLIIQSKGVRIRRPRP